MNLNNAAKAHYGNHEKMREIGNRKRIKALVDQKTFWVQRSRVLDSDGRGVYDSARMVFHATRYEEHTDLKQHLQDGRITPAEITCLSTLQESRHCQKQIERKGMNTADISYSYLNESCGVPQDRFASCTVRQVWPLDNFAVLQNLCVYLQEVPVPGTGRH